MKNIRNKNSHKLFCQPQIKKKFYYDTIAGCVLANRLTENKNWNVLLVEAGKVETFVQDIPVMAAYMQSTAYNWGYRAEAQSGSCLGEY